MASRLLRPRAERRSVAWADLTKVGIRTTSDGSLVPDLFWGFHEHGSALPGLVVPVGADGERALLEALQTRLAGFDAMAVCDAMASADDAFFVPWERAEPHGDGDVARLSRRRAGRVAARRVCRSTR